MGAVVRRPVPSLTSEYQEELMVTKSTYCRAAALLLVVGCATQEDNTPSVRDAHVADAIGALQSAVAGCAERRAACAADAADAAGCNDSFASCRAAAQADVAPFLDRAVNQCAESSRACREAAQTPEAKAACKEQLKACVGEDKPLPPARPDAGADRPSPSPVAECITTLRTCLEGDAAARECTTALHACVMAAVGNSESHDGGKPDDRGHGDAGRPEHPDAGGMDGEHRDAGRMDDEHPPAEAGMPSSRDAGAAAEAMACKTAYEQCIAGGESREACARMNKDCRE
jgi:hypothetical protein